MPSASRSTSAAERRPVPGKWALTSVRPVRACGVERWLGRVLDLADQSAAQGHDLDLGDPVREPVAELARVLVLEALDQSLEVGSLSPSRGRLR